MIGTVSVFLPAGLRILLLSILFNACYFLPLFYVLNHSHLWQRRGSLSFCKRFLMTNDTNLFVFLLAIFTSLKDPPPMCVCVWKRVLSVGPFCFTLLRIGLILTVERGVETLIHPWKFSVSLLFACMCIPCVWRSENNLGKLVPSLYHVCPGDQI